MNKKLKISELNRIGIEDFKSAKKDPIVVLLDDVRSLHNIGSVFRTCDAMAVKKLYLCGISATPPHREIRKTAIGATESVDWEYQKNAVDVLEKYKTMGYRIIAIEQTIEAISLEKFKYNGEKIVLIFGNEINGVNQKLINVSDISVEIPQWGTKHSLNISVSSGVVLWSIKMQIL
jgi:tRNA G18 (ribose-2'-O)-methylase SpoU